MKIIPLEDCDIEYDKRFYAPFLVESNCPNCGTICQVDLSDSYLSYPSLTEPSCVYFSCSDCEEKDDDEIEYEWTVQVQLKIELVPVEETHGNQD